MNKSSISFRGDKKSTSFRDDKSSTSFRDDKSSTSFQGDKMRSTALAKEADIPRNIVCCNICYQA